MKTFVLVFAFPLCLFGQSISVSPSSVVGFGQTKFTPEISVHYKYASINVIYHNFRRLNNVFIGLAFSPSVEYKSFTVSPIIALYNKPLYNEYGNRLNFGFSISTKIDENIAIYFKHLSNAGLAANPGLDNIGIRVFI